MIPLPTPQCIVFYNGKFVEISREFVSQNNNINIALNTAIDYCIEQNILSNQLRQYRAEVLDMMPGQFDKKKYERSLQNEGREIGYQEGINVGIEQGIEALILDNLEQKIPEEQIILKLIKLFHLTEEQARNYFNKFNP